MFPLSRSCLYRLFAFYAIAIWPLSAQATPAITCHCFTERSFDSAKPSAADPYLLATTQNSFMATTLNVDKKSIVMKKQRGASADDLWIAYGASLRSGAQAEALLHRKQGLATWKEVLASHGINAKLMGPRFAGALNSNQPTARLAETIVDELLVQHRVANEHEVAMLRKMAISNQEIILSTLITRKTGEPAQKLVLDVKKGAKSWGGLLVAAGIQSGDMQKEIMLLLGKQQ